CQDGVAPIVGQIQTFLDRFDMQSREAGLDAEVIIVDVNRPPERATLESVVRRPELAACTYEFHEVPTYLAELFQAPDMRTLSPLLALAEGIRHARASFVLITDVWTVLSSEVVSLIASRQLEKGCFYRVDDSRRQLPPERITADARTEAHAQRDGLGTISASIFATEAKEIFEYPLAYWTNANPGSAAKVEVTPQVVRATSDPRRWSYCVRYGPLRSEQRARYS